MLSWIHRLEGQEYLRLSRIVDVTVTEGEYTGDEIRLRVALTGRSDCRPRRPSVRVS